MSQFTGDSTPIEASVNSRFYDYLQCTPESTSCVGTVNQWVTANFPDFSSDNVKYDAIYLLALMFTTRVITYMALTSINHSSN
jgi:hypothetical protein